MPLSPQANQNNVVWAIREDLLATNEPLNGIHQALLNREAEAHKDSEVVVAGSTEEKQRTTELLNASTALRDRLADIALPALPTETLNNTKANLDEQVAQFTQDLSAIVASAQEAINALSSLPEINIPPSSAATAELEKKIQQTKATDKYLHEAILAIENEVLIEFGSLSQPNNPYAGKPVTRYDTIMMYKEKNGYTYLDEQDAQIMEQILEEHRQEIALHIKKRELWNKLKPLWDATGR